MALADPILRSLIRFSTVEVEDELQSNLQVARRDWDDQSAAIGIDGTLLTFLGGLFDKSGIVPTYALIHAHFRGLADAGDGQAMAAATRLELLAVSPAAFITGADFRYALDQYRDELLGQGLSQTILQTGTILSMGIDQTIVKQGQRIQQRLHGPQDALTYLSNELNTLLTRSGSGPAEGSLQGDAGLVWRNYEDRRDNPLKTGALSGLKEIDGVHRGLRPGELALVLGFVGHMKTTFVNAWAYKVAIYQQRHVGVVSCEIPLDDLRIMFYVMHSAHPKFAADPCYMGLSMTGIMYGSLGPAEERFFKDVVHDLDTCQDYGKLFYREPSANMTISDIQRWAEGHHRRFPLDLLVIDYLGLIDPGRGLSGMETGARLNTVIRQAKMMAMGFGAGKGIGLLSPFQANREGWKDAVKAGGRYQLTALAWANEAEKSADLVYYVYLDELLRTSKELAVGNLKTRLVPMITDQFRVYADPVSRTIDNLDLTNPIQAPVVL